MTTETATSIATTHLPSSSIINSDRPDRPISLPHSAPPSSSASDARPQPPTPEVNHRLSLHPDIDDDLSQLRHELKYTTPFGEKDYATYLDLPPYYDGLEMKFEAWRKLLPSDPLKLQVPKRPLELHNTRRNASSPTVSHVRSLHHHLPASQATGTGTSTTPVKQPSLPILKPPDTTQNPIHTSTTRKQSIERDSALDDLANKSKCLLMIMEFKNTLSPLISHTVLPVIPKKRPAENNRIVISHATSNTPRPQSVKKRRIVSLKNIPTLTQVPCESTDDLRKNFVQTEHDLILPNICHSSISTSSNANKSTHSNGKRMNLDDNAQLDRDSKHSKPLLPSEAHSSVKLHVAATRSIPPQPVPHRLTKDTAVVQYKGDISSCPTTTNHSKSEKTAISRVATSALDNDIKSGKVRKRTSNDNGLQQKKRQKTASESDDEPGAPSHPSDTSPSTAAPPKRKRQDKTRSPLVIDGTASGTDADADESTAEGKNQPRASRKSKSPVPSEIDFKKTTNAKARSAKIIQPDTDSAHASISATTKNADATKSDSNAATMENASNIKHDSKIKEESATKSMAKVDKGPVPSKAMPDSSDTRSKHDVKTKTASGQADIVGNDLVADYKAKVSTIKFQESTAKSPPSAHRRKSVESLTPNRKRKDFHSKRQRQSRSRSPRRRTRRRRSPSDDRKRNRSFSLDRPTSRSPPLDLKRRNDSSDTAHTTSSYASARSTSHDRDRRQRSRSSSRSRSRHSKYRDHDLWKRGRSRSRDSFRERTPSKGKHHNSDRDRGDYYKRDHQKRHHDSRRPTRDPHDRRDRDTYRPRYTHNKSRSTRSDDENRRDWDRRDRRDQDRDYKAIRSRNDTDGDQKETRHEERSLRQRDDSRPDTAKNGNMSLADKQLAPNRNSEALSPVIVEKPAVPSRPLPPLDSKSSLSSLSNAVKHDTEPAAMTPLPLPVPPAKPRQVRSMKEYTAARQQAQAPDPPTQTLSTESEITLNASSADTSATANVEADPTTPARSRLPSDSNMVGNNHSPVTVSSINRNSVSKSSNASNDDSFRKHRLFGDAAREEENWAESAMHYVAAVAIIVKRVAECDAPLGSKEMDKIINQGIENVRILTDGKGTVKDLTDRVMQGQKPLLGFATLLARAGGLLRVRRTLCQLKSNVKRSENYQNSITVQASADPTAFQAQMKQLADLNKVLFSNVNYMIGFFENWRLFEGPCSSLR
ncbi:hypothetical protein SeMB42_g06877, partial [Synchytrium endobioticum]